MRNPHAGPADLDVDEPLCFRFTATRRARQAAEPLELLRTPVDFRSWCASEADMPIRGEPSPRQLADAIQLREAIYRAARARADGRPVTKRDLREINRWAARDASTRALGDHGAKRVIPAGAGTDAALAVIATSAVNALGGVLEGVVRACAATDCGRVFLDTSRSRSRRWCSMGICGNRAKKAALKTRARME